MYLVLTVLRSPRRGVYGQLGQQSLSVLWEGRGGVKNGFTGQERPCDRRRRSVSYETVAEA